MIDISNYSEYIQNVVKITSDLLNLTITLVNRDFVRIAGTHDYENSINRIVKNHNLFRYVIEKDACVLIKNPRVDVSCIECSNKVNCKKTAAIYSSLKIDNVVVGGLAIIAFDEKQKRRLEDENLIRFVEQFSILITGKMAADENAAKLEKSLKKNIAILNSVNDGIIAIDHEGFIEQVNESALKIFKKDSIDLIDYNIKSLFPSPDLINIIDDNIPVQDEEIEIDIGSKKSILYISLQPINKVTKFGGAVLSFKTNKQISMLAKNISTSGTQPITFSNIIGDSPSFESIKEFSKKISIGNSNVLITGESGTGKEIFARAIHNESIRSNEPFIAVNCAAIPEPLLESELFGYEGGAFTGAKRGGKPGKCELAMGGTLFLDEIGDIPLFLQSKFLRMIQEKTIERVGGTKTIKLDLRIISATHRNLEEMIQNNEFREDLYYRINVIPLHLPPLRDRRDDIKKLSLYFINKYSNHLNKNIQEISDDAMNVFLNFNWPGNIRQLENAIEYAVNIESGTVITMPSLPQHILSTRTDRSVKQYTLKENFKSKQLDDAESQAIYDAIMKYGNTTSGKKEAAKHLGIGIATLYRKLKIMQM